MTIIYRNGLTYNGKKYDVKINIKEINLSNVSRDQTSFFAFWFLRGDSISDDDRYNQNAYLGKTKPTFSAGPDDCHIEIQAEYTVLDSNGGNICK